MLEGDSLGVAEQTRTTVQDLAGAAQGDYLSDCAEFRRWPQKTRPTYAKRYCCNYGCRFHDSKASRAYRRGFTEWRWTLRLPGTARRRSAAVTTSRFRHSAEIPNPGSESYSTAQNNGMVERLYAEVRNFAPADRSLVLLSLDQLSYQEMAEILGISPDNVGVRLNRMKKRLCDSLGGNANGS